MAATRDPMTLAVGIALIVIGVLLLVGRFSVGTLLDVAGLALLVLGILILVDVLPGGFMLGIVALVLGVLLLGNVVPFPASVRKSIQDVMEVVNIVVGIVCVVFGALKISGR